MPRGRLNRRGRNNEAATALFEIKTDNISPNGGRDKRSGRCGS